MARTRSRVSGALGRVKRRDILHPSEKPNLSTVGPTSAQLVRNEFDDAEQALMFTQLMRAMAEDDLREQAAEIPAPKPRSRKRN
jgi:hypothetical protein